MKLRLTTSQFLITFNNHKLSWSCYQKLYVRPTYQTYGNPLKSYFIWRIAISALQSFCFFTENLAHQPCPCFKSHGKTFFQLLWIYFHMFIHQFIQFFSKLICQLNSQFLIALVCLLFFSLHKSSCITDISFFLYCHYPYTYHTVSESHFPYIYPVSLKIFIYCILMLQVFPTYS